MTQEKDHHHIKYYVDEITRTAKNLQEIILSKNSMMVNPRNGADIKALPVYESDQYSLLNHTNDISDTEAEIEWPNIQNAIFLPAYIVKYKKNQKIQYRIVVPSSQNYCEARFFAAKELMHCHITDNGISATSTFPLVSDLLEDLARGNFAVNSTFQTMADQIAWVGAAEFLVPNTWLPMLKKMREDLKNKFPNSDISPEYRLAQLLRVPLGVVTFKLDKPRN